MADVRDGTEGGGGVDIAAPVNPNAIVAPNGFDEIIARYGNPRAYLKDDGTLRSTWVRERAAFVRVPWECFLSWDHDARVKRFQCHVEIKDHFEWVINALHEDGVGEELRFYGGGFNFRPQRGSAKLSTHVFICAWDFNPEENPLGSEGVMNPRIVQIFEANGFTWGGRWRRPDPMHFQFASGY